MDHDLFTKYLGERYQDQIGWYDTKAARNQTIYNWMQWTLIALAAITPILIELKISPLFADMLHIATVTSAIVAILTAGLKTFKYQENWIAYRTTCETLRKEKHFYDAAIGEYANADDREALFVDRVENLISRENTMWVSTHRSNSRSETKGGQ